MHYVIGDVHGCYDEMMALLNKIEAQDSEAIIYFVGDFIDRGPKVWEVLEWAMEHITLDGKYRAVRGNHEELVLEWYEEWLEWRKNFIDTRDRYEWPEPRTRYDFYKQLRKRNLLQPYKLQPIMEFFRSLPYNRLVTVTNAHNEKVAYRIVHAWYYHYENISLKDQKYANIWERNLCGNINSGEIIVHGHTPNLPDGFWEVPDKYAGRIVHEEKSNSINIDGGCCYQKDVPEYPCMLCGICLETLEEFYPYTFTERFEQFKEKRYLAAKCKQEDFPAFAESNV